MEHPVSQRKTARKALALAALAVLAFCLDSCASTYFYNKVIARNSKAFLTSSKDLSGFSRTGKTESLPQPPAPWIEGQPYETASITSRDGLALVGYWLPSGQPSGKTVILAHGYSSRGLDMSSFAEYYHEVLGYNVLMPDARGHGASGGDYIGFGWPDRLDYLDWIAWVIARQGKGERIVLHGISMGAATVLMASGEPMPPNVRAVVEDCGYTSVDAELGYQIERMYGLPRDPFVPQTSKLTKRKAGYSFEEASALAQVRKTRTPTLFIHGDADTFVPFEMGVELHAACPAEKELLVVHGAGHGLSWRTDRSAYTATLARFLARHVDGPDQGL